MQWLFDNLHSASLARGAFHALVNDNVATVARSFSQSCICTQSDSARRCSSFPCDVVLFKTSRSKKARYIEGVLAD